MSLLVGQLIEYYMYINIYLGIDLAWIVTAHAWIEKAGAVFDFLCRSYSIAQLMSVRNIMFNAVAFLA